jgi:hypothetical protein
MKRKSRSSQALVHDFLECYILGNHLVYARQLHNFIHVVLASLLEVGVRHSGVGDQEGPLPLLWVLIVVEDGGNVVHEGVIAADQVPVKRAAHLPLHILEIGVPKVVLALLVRRISPLT